MFEAINRLKNNVLVDLSARRKSQAPKSHQELLSGLEYSFLATQLAEEKPVLTGAPISEDVGEEQGGFVGHCVLGVGCSGGRKTKKRGGPALHVAGPRYL